MVGSLGSSSLTPIQATLEHELLATFADPAYRPPPLPTVAVELMTLSSKPDVATTEIVEVLERDEMLAAGVMRLVGSPLYFGRRPVASLHEAVVRLGLNTVRNAVFEATISRGVFEIPEYSEVLDQIRRHSIVTAYLTRIVCQHAETDVGDAFVAGLLHDLGFAAMLLSVTHCERPAPPLERFWTDIDELHQRATSKLLDLWHIPPSIIELASRHHTVDDHDPRRAALLLADHFSAEFGAEISGPQSNLGELLVADETSDLNMELAKRVLSLGDQECENVLLHAEQVIPNIVWL